jgi:hypothetical protein
MIGATYVVWSPIATDVVTDGMAFIEAMPERASTTWQVNVTVSVYSVEHLYAWQVGLEASLAVTTAAAIIPAENIFQNRTTVGLLVWAMSNGVVLGNCIVGQDDGASGNGILAQVTFQVDSLPTTFTIGQQKTFLLDDDLKDIPFTCAGE